MNKELTPLGELIEWLKKEAADLKSSEDCSDRSCGDFINICVIGTAIKLLPKERNMVEDAYQAAQIELVKIVSDSLGIALPKTSENLNKIFTWEEDNEDASDYFTSKYISE